MTFGFRDNDLYSVITILGTIDNKIMTDLREKYIDYVIAPSVWH